MTRQQDALVVLISIHDMESENNSLLNVPITEAERRAQAQRPQRAHSDASESVYSQHGLDQQYDPQLGRFGSLRRPEDRYDDPDQPNQQYSGPRTRSSTLPGIEEENLNYSEHEDDEPIIKQPRASTFPRPSSTQYAPLPDRHHLPASPSPQPHGLPPKFWQPIWLRKLTLIAFTIFVLALIVGLVVVCNDVDNGGGYHISSTAEHYAWTYVPTVILVFLVAIWRQIDFHTKTLTPWKSLALGPESPFDTVLVDYISEFQIVSLIAAFKRLHVPVLITISSLLISLGMTIASTGLFYSRYKEFTDTFSSALTSTFDASALNPAILSVTTFPNSSIYAYTQSVVNGLGPQLGVASGLAYNIPTLRSSSTSVPANSTFNITVEAFVPSITCRAANVTLEGQATISTTDFPYNSTDKPYGTSSNLTLNINENDICGSYPRLTFRGLDPLHYVVPYQTLESQAQELFCDGDQTRNPILLLTMVEVDYTQDVLTNVTREEGGDLPIALTTSRSISRMVNVLCQADYALNTVNITNNTALQGTAAISLSQSQSPQNKTLNGLTSGNMTTFFSLMLESNHGLFTETTEENFQRTPAFDLLAWTAGNGSYDQLFSDAVLGDAAQQIYQGAMPDFVSKNLVKHNSLETALDGPLANIVWTEERLFTNWTPVIIVITGLGIMALLTVGLVILMPQDVVPRDPSSIAAAATTLSRSYELNRLLRKLQSPQNKGIAAALNGYEVGTAIAVDESSGQRSFKIHVTEGRPQRDVQEIVPNHKFWNPWSASLPVLVITFLIPLVLIAVLQVLQNQSDKHHGLLTVPDDRGTLIASHFIPALATLLVAAAINNLDFYIALFAPWAKLFKANVSADTSILKNIVGHSALNAAYIAGKARWWGALAATLATIFASLLTVIISGLYLVEDYETPGPAQSLQHLDNFNLGLINSYSVSNDNGAGAMFDLIQQNYSFATGTFEEYAFPRVSLLPLSGSIPADSKIVGGVKGSLPAMRGNISCEKPTSQQMATINSTVRVTASYKLPDSCSGAIDSLNSSTVSFSADFSPAQGTTEFGGKLFDLRFGTNASQYGHLGEANSSLVGDNPAVGCPSIVFIWGDFALGSDDQNAANVAICYQKVQTVNLNVTLQGNTTDIATKPFRPFPNEQSAVSQPNPNGTDIFSFRIQNNIARQLGDFAGTENVDPFFQSMLNGSIVMDKSRFLGNRTLAMMGISHTYRMYMAQVINAMLRESIDDAKLRTRQQTNINMRTTISQSRLVQDNVSKTVLHALLALTAICILIGYFFTKMRNILPCNPCSIAGTMSLLAGSDLCYLADDGVCECCGKVRRSFRSADGRVQIETIHADDNEHAEEKPQVIRSGAEWMADTTFARIFQGRTYSLGWWEPQPKLKRYGVDIGSAANTKEGDWYLGRRRNSETFEDFHEQIEGRGRTRAFSDVNERGAYQRTADPSPGVEAHEMKPLEGAGDIGRAQRFRD